MTRANTFRSRKIVINQHIQCTTAKLLGMPLIKRLPVFTLLTPLLAANVSFASEHPYHWSVVWENDAIANDDGGYTNGFALNGGHLLTPENNEQWEQKATRWLPFPQNTSYQEAVSFQLAHAIYTPSDIDTAELIEDDRPYAGLLLGALNLYRFDTKRSSRYEFVIGVIGPASGAEYIQRYIHDVIGTVDPSGWDHQIGNEIVVRAGYEQLWRLYESELSNGIEYDLLSAADIRAGNLSSDIGGGFSFRFGSGLASSFPMAWLIPGRTLPALAGSQSGDWNVFATLYANYVFNDITIEGNTFKDSHGVHLVNEQALYVVGGSYRFSNWMFSGSVKENSHEFEESGESTMFGSFSFSFLW